MDRSREGWRQRAGWTGEGSQAADSAHTHGHAAPGGRPKRLSCAGRKLSLLLLFYGPFLWNALKELTEFVQILTSHSACHKFGLYSCPYLEKNCAVILFCSLFSNRVPEGHRFSQSQ